MNAIEYNRINTLLADYSAANATLERVEAEIVTAQLHAAETLLPQHAEIKIKVSDLEVELRKLAVANYDALFTGKKSHETPFGGLKFVRSSKLDVSDAEKVLAMLELACLKEKQKAEQEGRVPAYTWEQLTRRTVEPNLEALEKLPDDVLKIFGIERVEKENFLVVPFEMAGDQPKGDKGKKKGKGKDEAK